ncbi:hypothetical protein DSCA_08090 [Desulfosarcina alkanivorans]|uniref:Uncharacterized protein n=1 Tax=Desulfosarcina alkanivorans TaxID=571177 RepID=A0A5K7YGH9_9BACT|nr:hypothetical protein DSCA_08090 [Desulfosarcina alkanivorans]
MIIYVIIETISMYRRFCIVDLLASLSFGLFLSTTTYGISDFAYLANNVSVIDPFPVFEFDASSVVG